jgi:hypothetical protein
MHTDIHASNGIRTQAPAFEQAETVHVGFVVDNVALWQVFSEYFGFPHGSTPIIIYHSGLIQ